MAQMAAPAIEWQVEAGLLEYPQALAAMQARVAAIRAGMAGREVADVVIGSSVVIEDFEVDLSG